MSVLGTQMKALYLFRVTVYLAGLVYLIGKVCMKNFSCHRVAKTFCFLEKEYCDMILLSQISTILETTQIPEHTVGEDGDDDMR